MNFSLSRAQIREIDRRAISELGIPGSVLMENAGVAVAEQACKLLSQRGPYRVGIVCGSGNNGGDGFVVARHLANLSRDLKVFLIAKARDLQGDSKLHYDKLQTLRSVIAEEISSVETLIRFASAGPMLWVDAIFGTGLNRPVEGLAQYCIEAMNESRHPILSIDIPSGLDADTGEILGSAIHATKTVTFVREKIGFNKNNGQLCTGEVIVVPIGIPESAIQKWVNESRL